MGEISCFCISKDFRRGQGDGMFPASEDPETRSDERRVIPNMTLGLTEGLIRMSLDHGLFYQCAVMERPLLRLLDRSLIRFQHIGPLVEYHDSRQPFMLKLETMLQAVSTARLARIGQTSLREQGRKFGIVSVVSRA